jgi:hypothetical protein
MGTVGLPIKPLNSPSTQWPDVEKLFFLECKSKFWFPDGDVLLQAGKVLFRVHRSVLAKFSTKFKTLQYGDRKCPVVVVDYTAQELETLLEAVYFLYVL